MMNVAKEHNLKKLICSNAPKMLRATAKTVMDGRERAFYIYQEDDNVESTPIRVGSEDSIRLKRDSETLRDMKELYPDMLLVGFHTHPSPYSFNPSQMDVLKATAMNEDVTCIGSVESPETLNIDVWCWVIDKETGDVETLNGEIDECFHPRRKR
jgi:proteasome lid subunit RPN8/RPN11